MTKTRSFGTTTSNSHVRRFIRSPSGPCRVKASCRAWPLTVTAPVRVATHDAIRASPMTRLMRCSVPVSGNTPTNSKNWPIGPRSSVSAGQPAAGIGENHHITPLEVGDLLDHNPITDEQRVLHR